MKIVHGQLLECGEGNELAHVEWSTVVVQSGTAFGVVLTGCAYIGGRVVHAGEYFSRVGPVRIDSKGTTAVFIRQDWQGHDVFAGRVGQAGDVRYIDGCTDSLLVCPPRKGDPCLNALYFPPNINQTFHTHPSQRLGAVLSGRGVACLEGKEIALVPGTVFLIETNEVHRFRTEVEPMVVVAYHPDSDWGPTDEVHPMINRTFLTRFDR